MLKDLGYIVGNLIGHLHRLVKYNCSIVGQEKMSFCKKNGFCCDVVFIVILYRGLWSNMSIKCKHIMLCTILRIFPIIILWLFIWKSSLWVTIGPWFSCPMIQPLSAKFAKNVNHSSMSASKSTLWILIFMHW